MTRVRLDPSELQRAEVAMRTLRDEGCPVAQDPPAMARVAVRRWYSVERRHGKAPSREIRINDVASGLIDAFEDNPRTVGPLKMDYLCVAEAVAAAVDERATR